MKVPERETCSRCDGDKETYSRDTCPECNGKGWTMSWGDEKTCYTCQGKGTIQGQGNPCSKCDGKGYTVHMVEEKPRQSRREREEEMKRVQDNIDAYENHPYYNS